MLDMNEIYKAIEELEQKCPTTYPNCEKLASLYIIRQYYRGWEQEKETDDPLAIK